MKAYVLIDIRPGEILNVVHQLRRTDGVEEATMTLGPYDAVAIIAANDLKHLGEILADRLQPIPGVVETLTCVAVDS